ncbi:MAG TPA: GNAT family N-acetyltransferase [archaeon]|nr:GNAT family N-acetyltransferase [archaeon]
MTSDFEVRLATEREVHAVQELDSASREDGFQHYNKLFRIYPEGTLVAIDKDTVAGYIGTERLNSKDLEVGTSSNFKRSMPPWDHDPATYHRPDGNVLYILGHAVLPDYREFGVSHKLITDFLSRAKRDESIDQVAVIYNSRHPALRDPLKFWGGYGFAPLLDTYDPKWKHAADKPVDGGIIWARNV